MNLSPSLLDKEIEEFDSFGRSTMLEVLTNYCVLLEHNSRCLAYRPSTRSCYLGQLVFANNKFDDG